MLGKQKTPHVGTDEGNAEKDQMQAKKRKLEQFMDHAVRVGRAAFRVRARLGRRSATGVAQGPPCNLCARQIYYSVRLNGS